MLYYVRNKCIQMYMYVLSFIQEAQAQLVERSNGMRKVGFFESRPRQTQVVRNREVQRSFYGNGATSNLPL